MHAISLLIPLAAKAYGLAIPQSDGGDGGGISLFPASTNVTYYQGTASEANACMMPVGHGTLSAETCTPIRWMGLAISQVPNDDCFFTLYPGSAQCDTTATGSKTTEIPAGNETTCVVGGVQDGGKRQWASGVWSCD